MHPTAIHRRALIVAATLSIGLISAPAFAQGTMSISGEITHFMGKNVRIAPGGSHDMKQGKILNPTDGGCTITRDGNPATSAQLQVGDQADATYVKTPKGFMCRTLKARSTSSSGRAQRPLTMRLKDGRVAKINLKGRPGDPAPIKSSNNNTNNRTRRRGKKGLTKAQKIKLLILICRKKPSVKQCKQIRHKCNQKVWPAGSDLNHMCGQLGWGPSGGGGSKSPAAMNILVGYQYTAAGDDAGKNFDQTGKNGVDSAWHGLRLSGRSIGVDSLVSVGLDAEISKAGENWYYDLGLMVGAGKWINDKYGVALVGGFGTSGISDDTLKQTWQIPAELFLVAHISRKITVTAFGRVAWYLQGDEKKIQDRKRGASTIDFADQLTVGTLVYYGAKGPAWRPQAKYGVSAGFIMREMQDSKLFGIVLGVGQSHTPNKRGRAMMW